MKLNNIYMIWKIGKNVYENQYNYENIIKKYSDYYSYLFGNSYMFTRENIILMKKFYLSFPIFYDRLENITWNQYKLLLSISNKKERMFYFNLSLLFNSDYYGTNTFINNRYFYRI